MSRDIGRPEQIAITYTVPSQENEYLQARMASAVANTAGAGSSSSANLNAGRPATADATKRRKRSESMDEDDEEEEEEEDDEEYLPERENRSYGTGQSRSHAATSNSNHSSGQYGQHGQRHSPGEPYELSIPSHDPSSLTVPSMSTSGPSGNGASGSGSGTSTDVRPGSASGTVAGSGSKKSGSGKPAGLGPDGVPPPKKKRRRQALSCTECKRRKIRCDRVQPCAPCTRRGEAEKCKWNILEPVEKFVTRREYDEIKDSLNRLETILTTNGGSSGSATEEVAAAVNVVKSKAVLLSKVISGPPTGTPHPHPHAPHSSLTPNASLAANNIGNNNAVSGTINNTVSLTPNTALNLNMGLNPNPNPTSSSTNPHSLVLSSNVKGLNELDSPAASAAAVARVGMLIGSGSAVPTTANLAGTASGGGGTNAAFGFSPFNLNVPSQSHPHPHSHPHQHQHHSGHGRGQSHPHPHLSPQSDDEFYRTNRAGSISHSSSNSFSRSPVHLPSSSHMPNSFPNPSNAPSASPHYGHFSSGMTTDPISGQTYGASAHPGHPGHQQRAASIDMTGFVVEDQSGNGMLRPESASSLSTLATVANASAMQNLHSLRRADVRSPTVTLPSLGSNTPTQHSHPHSRSHSHSNSLSQMQTQHSHPHSGSMNPPQTMSLQSTTNPNIGITGISAISNISPMITPTSLPMESRAVREAELKHVMNGCLPRKEISDRLVDFYFDKIEWSITLLHRPTFMRTYQAFWFASEEERFKVPGPASPFAPQANASSQEDGLTPTWIALLASVLCVSLERMGAYDAKTIGISSGVEDYRSQCRRLYDASQAVLILADFIRYRSLEVVQTLILHLHCQQTVGITAWETHLNGTLTLAVRLAIMMGLNKLSSEKPGTNPRPGLLKRELGRRAWWNLVERDWTSASRVGYTYVIHPFQNFADFPANVEWEEIEHSRNVFMQRGRDIWTTVSSFTARLELARLNRQLIDQYNTQEGVSYSMILKHFDQLNEVVDQSPSVLLRPDDEFEEANELARWDRLGFTFYFNSTIIKLHRPYFVTALLGSRSQRRGSINSGATVSTRSTYSESISACIRAAEAILDTIEESKASNYPGIQWWDTTMHYYAAAVVLLIERWYSTHPKPDESVDQEDAEERKRKIVAATALVRDQAESIGVFCPAAAALDVLLDATTSTRRKSKKNARRGMDLNDVVNPVNVSSRTSNDIPIFVKEWIATQIMDDSSGKEVSAFNAASMIATAPTLSTANLLPGMALVADTTPDSIFWSRLFDLAFAHCGDLSEFFFPPIDLAPNSPMAGVVENQGDTSSGTQQYMAESSTTVGSDSAGLGASAIWSSMSGPIGSMAAGDGWARSSPYDNTSSGGA